jgi:hypothetical protein
MRLSASIWLFIVAVSCTEKKSRRFIPEAFEYPVDSIGEGKTFIFHDSVQNADTYVALNSFMRGGDTVQTFTRYNATTILDSQVFNRGQLVETYYPLSSLHPRLYKGEAIADEVTSDGTKPGVSEKSYTYRNDTVTVTLSSKTRFLKDTSVLWQGHELPCLVIQSNRIVDAQSKSYKGLNYTVKTQYVGYLAKNLGVIKYVLSFRDRQNNDHYMVWDLVAIEDGKKVAPRFSTTP